MRAPLAPLVLMLLSASARAESSGWIVCVGSESAPQISRQFHSTPWMGGAESEFKVEVKRHGQVPGVAKLNCRARHADGRIESVSQYVRLTTSSSWASSGNLAIAASIDCGCTWEASTPGPAREIEFSGPKEVKQEKDTRAKYLEAHQKLQELQKRGRDAEARKAVEAAERARTEEAQRRAKESQRRVDEAERKAAEARQRAEAAQRRYDSAMTQAKEFDARAQESIRSGQGDAMGYSLQASLSRMQANASLNGQDEAARQIGLQQARLAQQHAVVNAGVGLAAGLISLWVENDARKEREEIARIEREDAMREAREFEAEQRRRQEAQRVQLETERVAAETELRQAQQAAAEQARVAQNEALATQMSSSDPARSVPTLKSMDKPGVALKPLVTSRSAAAPALRALPEANDRRDGLRYLRVFVDGACPVRVTGLSGLELRSGVFTPIPTTSAPAVTLTSDCVGVAQLFEGRATTARGSGLFGRNQPLTIPLPASR